MHSDRYNPLTKAHRFPEELAGVTMQGFAGVITLNEKAGYEKPFRGAPRL